MPRALISVYDKTGVDDLARGLVDLGWELVSSRRHRDVPRGARACDVTRVEEVTEAPEMLGGRVKTLHPRIHAGILARRDLPEDMATLAEHEIEPIDLVCVNLYPFTSVAGRPRRDRGRGGRDDRRRRPVDAARRGEELRATSSSSRRPDQYDVVLGELREHGDVSLDTRRELAREAFATTAAYEAAIANWFGETEPFPEQLTLTLRRRSPTSPTARTRIRRRPTTASWALAGICSRRSSSSAARSSRTTTSPTSRAARRIAREFALPAVVIVKHANPCGVAVAATIEEAWERALAADPVSAFGCVAVLNRAGRRRARRADRRALRRGAARAGLRRRRARRAAREEDAAHPRPTTSAARDAAASATTSACSAACSCRIATTTSRTARRCDGRAAARSTEAQWGDLLFAWRVCKHVSSNAIVLVADCRRSASAPAR